MTTIHKYRLEAAGEQDLLIPCGSQGIDILCAAWQHGYLHLWAHVDPEAAPIAVRVFVRTTGAPMGEAAEPDAEYLGSVLVAEGAIVFHVFVKPPTGTSFQSGDLVSVRLHRP